MEPNKKEAADGIKWLFGAGAFAVALTLFLAYADYRLRHSEGERVLGDTLHELRTAQSSLGSGPIDDRVVHRSSHDN